MNRILISLLLLLLLRLACTAKSLHDQDMVYGFDTVSLELYYILTT
jgi:hypothetical protein